MINNDLERKTVYQTTIGSAGPFESIFIGNLNPRRFKVNRKIVAYLDPEEDDEYILKFWKFKDYKVKEKDLKIEGGANYNLSDLEREFLLSKIKSMEEFKEKCLK